MKNEDLIYKFCTGNFNEDKVYRCGNLTIQDDRLFSYNTCIAEYGDDRSMVYINITKYSSTTSRHQNIVLKYFKTSIQFELYDGVPINTRNLSRHAYDKQRES